MKPIHSRRLHVPSLHVQPARLPFPSKPRTPRPPCQVTLSLFHSLQSSLDDPLPSPPKHAGRRRRRRSLLPHGRRLRGGGGPGIVVRRRGRRGHQQAGFLAAVHLAIAALVVQELAAALPGATAARPPLRLIGQGRRAGQRRRQCSAHHVAAVPTEPGSRVPGLRGSQPELRGSPSPRTPSSLHAEHEKLADGGVFRPEVTPQFIMPHSTAFYRKMTQF